MLPLQLMIAPPPMDDASGSNSDKEWTCFENATTELQVFVAVKPANVWKLSRDSAFAAERSEARDHKSIKIIHGPLMGNSA